MVERSRQANQFDAIVIGSGIGGLTVAALLARLHQQRVLILEQHFTIGGFTHEFERQGKFHWDVGLHYVGQMAKGDLGRTVFDYLTEGRLQWQKLPDPFEKFIYPDFTFELPAQPQAYQAALIQQFPAEKRAIQQYFADLKTAATWYTLAHMRDLFPRWLRPLLRAFTHSFGGLVRFTTQAYLEQRFRHPHLKALLVSQWGTYGLPPAESSFGVHALLATHYLWGAYYPVGGAGEIARQILPGIERAGGRAIAQRQVTEILIEQGVAVGVKAQKTGQPDAPVETYLAPVVISDAGAVNTYLKLIPADYPIHFREQIRQFPKGCSAMTLYLGFKESPARLGFRGENHWIYRSYDHNQMFQAQLTSPTEAIQSCYLSFPSLKNPQAQHHTAEVIVFAGYEGFAQWRDGLRPAIGHRRWRHRDPDYQALKTQITAQIMDLVESHYPGFQELVAYTELSTPLTVEHFDASDRGAIYGIPSVPARLDQDWIAARTPIRNLYLTGSDACLFGIMGAMMGGVKTAGIINGPWGYFKVIAQIMKSSG